MEGQLIGFGVSHEPGDGKKLGDVGFRFPREVQGEEIEGLPPALIAPLSLADIARARVVGGEGQQPIPFKETVHILQEGVSGFRGLQHVPALIVPPILLKAVEAPRGGHKLPET